MLDLIVARAGGAGLERYEVSAFARPGHRARHNLNYWEFGDYLGIGAGAHGKLSFAHRIVRQVRLRDPAAYMAGAEAGSALASETEVARADLPFEFMLNALRLRKASSSRASASAPACRCRRSRRRSPRPSGAASIERDLRHVRADRARLRFPQRPAAAVPARGALTPPGRTWRRTTLRARAAARAFDAFAALRDGLRRPAGRYPAARLPRTSTTLQCPSRSIPTTTTRSALSLDGALQLLQQSGHVLARSRATRARSAWLQAVIDGLCELSSRDPLTGLANRRHFELTLASEVDRVARAGEPALRADDRHRPLQARQRRARPPGRRRRAQGRRARARRMHPADGHGGALRRRGVRDDPAQLPAVLRASTVAERIRARVERAQHRASAPARTVSVTVSIGGAFAPQWVRSSPLLWVERADQQLYRAKSEGRNRACLEQPAVSLVSAEEKGLLFGTSQFQPTLDEHARASHPRDHQRQGRRRQDLPLGQPRRRARAPGRARARARRRPRPGQPRRRAQPVSQDHAARRLHRQGDARRGDPAGAGRLLGAARRLGPGRVLAPDAGGARAAASRSSTRSRRASTASCSTPAPASPTSCCTRSRSPTTCSSSPRPSRPR